MTHSRAGKGNIPTALNALYYGQRASAGLIITEATQVGRLRFSIAGIKVDFYYFSVLICKMWIVTQAAMMMSSILSQRR